MESLFETAVMASIVLAILFFAYHVGIYILHQKANQLASDQLQKVKGARPTPQPVDRLPGSQPAPSYTAPAESATVVSAPPPAPVIQQVPQLPEPTDPQHRPQDTSTFVSQLRQPENSFHKHEFIAGPAAAPALPAQNEDDMGGISAYDCAGEASFSALA